MTLIFENGPVSKALRTYDPNIRVRWSWEKRKWAVEAKAKRGKMILPPVFYEPVQGFKDLYRESLLPEKSDRYIQYHDQYYVICWARKLNWALYHKIVRMDVHRHNNERMAVNERMRDIFAAEDAGKEKFAKKQKDVAEMAYDKYRWLSNRQPWND